MIKNLIPRLAERGRIKIGGLGDERKKQGSNETYRLPVKYDHFLITTMQRDAAGRLMEDASLMHRLKEKQGIEKLTEIPIRLLYDDIDLNFTTRYAVYKGKTCWCTGDGESAQRRGEGKVYEGQAPRDARENEYGTVPCPCERCDPTYDKPDKCKTLGSLSCLIQGVDRIGGVWGFRTTSFNSVTAILSSLRLIQTLTGGPLAGIPLYLVLSPKTVTVPAGRQAGQTMVVYVVSLEYRGPEEQLAQIGYDTRKRQIEHRVRMDLIEDQARKLLVAPHQEPADLQAETAAEFYPDGAAVSGGNDQGKAGEKVIILPLAPPESPEQATAPQAFTLPSLMEWLQNPNPPALSGLPIPLQTTLGTHIGQWVEYGEGLECEPAIVLEVVSNLEEVADGLTPEEITRSFTTAGIKTTLRRQAAGIEAKKDPPSPPPPPEKPAAKRQGGSKALF